MTCLDIVGFEGSLKNGNQVENREKVTDWHTHMPTRIRSNWLSRGRVCHRGTGQERRHCGKLWRVCCESSMSYKHYKSYFDTFNGWP